MTNICLNNIYLETYVTMETTLFKRSIYKNLFIYLFKKLEYMIYGDCMQSKTILHGKGTT